VAGFGPALLDRAILDALGRLTGQSFLQMLACNAPGVEVRGELTPDLTRRDLGRFLAALPARRELDVRHTVGLVDPLAAGDQRPGERINDGLPETLEDVVRAYGVRYYKLKVGGDPAADLERLARIAAVLHAHAGDYRITLDGNEQFEDEDGILELWALSEERPELAKLCAATLYIEQPIHRSKALARRITALARHKPVIIDESDGELAALPAALALGYRGVSSKSCRGIYKSLLNAARIAKLNREWGGAGYLLSAEDLTALAGVSVQQDLALVAALGLTHAERNGHHYVDGMSFAPEGEQSAF